MNLEHITKISSLEEFRKMGHNIEQFHNTQLDENQYMEMVIRTANIVLQKMPRKKLAKILEIGAGTGILSNVLLKKLVESNRTFLFHITEPDSALISFCKNYIVSKGYEFGNNQNISFKQMKAEDVDKLSQKYDIITSTEVFHHIPYEDKIITSDKLLHQLDSNGRMIIGDNFVPNKYTYVKEDALIDDRIILAPQVAENLEYFWNRLHNGNLPESFKKALAQQREGMVECKTSLPHLIKILSKADSQIEDIIAINSDINKAGGYAILTVKSERKISDAFKEYLNNYRLKQAIGGLQYDALAELRRQK
jgi:protein-L-isoaspartate O-methyltransferase